MSLMNCWMRDYGRAQRVQLHNRWNIVARAQGIVVLTKLESTSKAKSSPARDALIF